MPHRRGWRARSTAAFVQGNPASVLRATLPSNSSKVGATEPTTPPVPSVPAIVV